MAKKHRSSPDFAAIGETFNDATTQLVGGISTDNQARVLADLTSVQKSLSKLLTRQPDTFSEESAIHVQNVVDQLNLEIDAVKSFGTDPFAAKYINDVQRDLIDIINGDDALAALANRHGAHGFAVVPDLLSDPAPFLGSPEQTAFMTKFVADANDLGTEAVALIASGIGASDPMTIALEQKIQDFASNADAFTKAQGGLYSARFDNEFAYYGVNGTASRALVDGLADGDAAKVQAAASVLAGNAVDVATNMLGFGNPPTPPNSGIPEDIDSFAVAGTVFNDATTRLIGGVYDGNRNDIVAALLATQQGIQSGNGRRSVRWARPRRCAEDCRSAGQGSHRCRGCRYRPCGQREGQRSASGNSRHRPAQRYPGGGSQYGRLAGVHAAAEVRQWRWRQDRPQRRRRPSWWSWRWRRCW